LVAALDVILNGVKNPALVPARREAPDSSVARALSE